MAGRQLALAQFGTSASSSGVLARSRLSPVQPWLEHESRINSQRDCLETAQHLCSVDRLSWPEMHFSFFSSHVHSTGQGFVQSSFGGQWAKAQHGSTEQQQEIWSYRKCHTSLERDRSKSNRWWWVDSSWQQHHEETGEENWLDRKSLKYLLHRHSRNLQHS